MMSLPPDDDITQREGVAYEEEEEQVRRRGQAKVRGRRQEDFDLTAEEDKEPQPGPASQSPTPSAQNQVWSQNQQRLLELALQQFPRGTSERWQRIAAVVPGKNKVPTRPERVLEGLLLDQKSVKDLGLAAAQTDSNNEPKELKSTLEHF